MTMKLIGDVMKEHFAEIRVRKEPNPKGNLYYPVCQAAQDLCSLIPRRKAFVESDIPKIKEFGKAIGIEIKVINVATDEEEV